METITKIKQAILRGEQFFKGVKLPIIQSRTFYQKRTYALLKAQEIFEKHFKNSICQLKTDKERFQQILINFETL